MDPKGLDLSSLYQDDGYLTFQAMPIETRIENDTIDIEVRMMEGKQFRIGKVIVQGNTKTNDHVIFREIRTRPGDHSAERTSSERSGIGAAITSTRRHLASIPFNTRKMERSYRIHC